MNNRNYILLLPLVLGLAALAGDPRTNSPTPEPAATNAPPSRVHPVPTRPNRPQQLQSAETTNAPAAAPTPAAAPKAIGIVLREVYAVQPNASTPPLLVVPERYLRDLTNVYRHQYIPVLRLEEP
jgi:hypothetical protein